MKSGGMQCNTSTATSPHALTTHKHTPSFLLWQCARLDGPLGVSTCNNRASGAAAAAGDEHGAADASTAPFQRRILVATARRRCRRTLGKRLGQQGHARGGAARAGYTVSTSANTQQKQRRSQLRRVIPPCLAPVRAGRNIGTLSSRATGYL